MKHFLGGWVDDLPESIVKYSTCNFSTPMSVGTIWAMDRKFFFEIGGFDDKMILWGGENIELPIRVST